MKHSIFFLLLCSVVQADGVSDILADRKNSDISDLPFRYYFTLDHIPVELQPKVASVLSFVIASSSTQQAVENCTPIPIGPTAFRIDTRTLNWNAAYLSKQLITSPYHKSINQDVPQLIQHPVWFIQHLADSRESKSYFGLLYGDEDITRDEFLKRWETNDDPFYRIGYIEGESGVSVSRTRWLMNFPNGVRTDVWGTLDFFKLDETNDPLNNFDYPISRWKSDPIHDGEEWIAGMPKFSITSRQRGRLQAYALFDNKGGSVTEAPGRLVRDSTGFRNSGVITNFGSCVQCHPNGLNALNRDETRQYIQSGATIYTESNQASSNIDQLLLSPTEDLIKKANEEYAIGVKMVSGMEPEQLALAFQEVVQWYDQPVTLEQACLELRTTPEKFKLAMAWVEVKSRGLHPRQAALTHDTPCPRSIWESIYTLTYLQIKDYQNAF